MEEKLKHLGADLDSDFVLKFRDYCLKNDFKQKTLIFRLVEWWVSQDPIIQEHIYRGRAAEALSQISEEVQGRAVVSRAKAQTASLKQTPARKPSKSA